MANRGHCQACRKATYSSYRIANKVRIRLNRKNRMDREEATDDGIVYWCRESGGYHLTSWSLAEYDRRNQERLTGD